MSSFSICSYVTFHDQMSSIIITYPLETKEELQNYDKKLCEYFGVDRNPPHKVQLMYMYNV